MEHLVANDFQDHVGFEERESPTIAAHKVRSVSYTHLRAHETVLDLVCRLLLEKKKIIYSTNINTAPGHDNKRARRI